MKWLDGITDSMDTEFEQTLGDGEGQGSLQSMGSQRVRHDLVTEQQQNLYVETLTMFRSSPLGGN